EEGEEREKGKKGKSARRGRRGRAREGEEGEEREKGKKGKRTTFTFTLYGERWYPWNWSLDICSRRSKSEMKRRTGSEVGT
ncbi:hypothetical protein, partial [Haloarchaeobius sp. DYHT-AS-18]|uniref:hypothetical protein n=1 Tax=Haloarchaeobius sp. DYHT-AS-18 TaxID=3446117 RepID=UPI003EB8F7CE